jgi:hypothetical protein
MVAPDSAEARRQSNQLKTVLRVSPRTAPTCSQPVVSSAPQRRTILRKLHPPARFGGPVMLGHLPVAGGRGLVLATTTCCCSAALPDRAPSSCNARSACSAMSPCALATRPFSSRLPVREPRSEGCYLRTGSGDARGAWGHREARSGQAGRIFISAFRSTRSRRWTWISTICSGPGRPLPEGRRRSTEQLLDLTGLAGPPLYIQAATSPS